MNVKEILRQIKKFNIEKIKIDQCINELCNKLTIEKTLSIEKVENNKYKFVFYDRKPFVQYNLNAIIQIMKINHNDFIEKMKEFNGKLRGDINSDWYHEDIIVFEIEEDAERALEWIKSVFIMNKLSE